MFQQYKRFQKIILLPVLIGLSVFMFYGFNWNSAYKMMGTTFFVSFPYIIGVVSIMKADIKRIQSLKYRLFHPWLILFIVLLLTMLLKLEGWACWIMLFPFLGFFASLGGYLAGELRFKEDDKGEKLHLSFVFLIILLVSPLESMSEYQEKIVETQTQIIIKSNPKIIWDNITSVYPITKKEDTSILTKLLAFPRPLKAILDKKSVGGYRKALFTEGLIFYERVSEYEDQKRMFFSITANTFEIPSTTFDKHLLIGGDYFDMIDGEYRLIKVKEGYKVLLTSHFKVKTSFNWYAGFLGQMIMRDIQNNILNIVKLRSQG